MDGKIKNFFRRSLGFMVVTVTSAAYVATAFITLESTGKTVWQVVSDGAVVYFLGLFLNRFFGLQGMILGEEDPRVVATNRLHAEKVTTISPYMGKLDEWCHKKNVQNLVEQRTKMLATEGMYYGDFFDENGSAKEFTFRENMMKNRKTRRLEKLRFRCYEKAIRMKLSPLSSTLLTSEGGHADDPYNFGRTKWDYERNSVTKDAVAKIAFAVVFGFFSAELIKNFSYAELIWKGFQIGIFLLIGVSKMYMSKFFITDEYRGRVIKKIDCLQMFENDMVPTQEKHNLEKYLMPKKEDSNNGV